MNERVKWFWRHLVGAIACVVSLSACGTHTDNPVAPVAPGPTTARTYSATLASPNSDDGAIAFLVSGAAIDTVTSTQGVVFLTRRSATQVEVIVAGNLSAGKIATVQFSTAVAQSAIAVSLEQVAARSYTERGLTGYALGISQ